jgi:hypothetical protein
VSVSVQAPFSVPVFVPGDVVAVTLALEALVPLSVTKAGDTVQVPAGGATEQLKATIPVKPLTGATLSV